MPRFVSPFSTRTLPEWMEVIEKSTSAEDRYRGLLAVNSMASFSDRFDWCRKLLEDADSSVRAIAVKTLGELKLEA
ncbi:MAG: HEAT repeat domain-containing protein, partial [Planctomycetes bacterium]|nr:HEAT repeat domain-containing protein [Planctomycetota bacterium]